MNLGTKKIYRPRIKAYGARELKGEIHTNTLKGFIASFTMMAVFFLVYFTVFPKTEIYLPPLRPGIRVGPTIVIDYQKPKTLAVNTGVRKQFTGIKEIMGTLVPIPDLEINGDISEIATMKNMHLARSVEGDGLDPFLPDNIDEYQPVVKLDIKDKRIEPEPEALTVFHVEKAPGYDTEMLHSNLKYPRQAIYAKIEGTVLVNVLIDRFGKVVRTNIEYSKSILLEEAAIEAIMKTTFTPALNNGYNVDCWISIPVKFVLKN